MTFQVGNLLIIGEKEFELSSYPDAGFWEYYGPVPTFCSLSTANILGYVTHWTVRNDKLFLTGLAGALCLREIEESAPKTIRCRGRHYGPCLTKDIILSDICDAPAEGLFASWFTGELLVRTKRLHSQANKTSSSDMAMWPYSFSIRCTAGKLASPPDFQSHAFCTTDFMNESNMADDVERERAMAMRSDAAWAERRGLFRCWHAIIGIVVIALLVAFCAKPALGKVRTWPHLHATNWAINSPINTIREILIEPYSDLNWSIGSPVRTAAYP